MRTQHCKLFVGQQRLPDGKTKAIPAVCLIMGKKSTGRVRYWQEGKTLQEAREKLLALAKTDALIVSYKDDEGNEIVEDYSLKK